MIDNKRAAAQRRLEEAARREAELQRLRATGAMLLHHASHPLVRGVGGGARLVQRERKGNAKARKRGARLKIEKLKTSGLLELTPEVLQGKFLRDAVLEKLNVSGGTLPTVDITRTVDFDYEEIISLDDYDTGSRSVLETDAMLEESQAKRVCSRSQMDREAQDLRNRLEQSRTFRRETGLMNFPPTGWALLPRRRQPAGQVRTTGCCRTTEWNLTAGATAGPLPTVVAGEAEHLPSVAPAGLATVADRGSGSQATSRDRMQAPGPTEDARGQGPPSAEAAARSRGEERRSLCESCICRTSWTPRSRRRWQNCPP
jgi:hypothetical protein